MNRQDSIQLFESIYPGFFELANIRELPENCVCDEMILPLEGCLGSAYEKELDDAISFGYFEGKQEELVAAVEKVDSGWVPYFDGKHRVYCGYLDGKIASFCLVEDMGMHTVGGRKIKVGGPGCVGTLPEYRNKGIGLTMVKQVTRILQEEEYDYSYIHYTGVAPWYEKLGYKTVVKWNKNGVL